MSLRVLFCTSEAVPFAKTGGLADVAGALPPVLAGLGHDVRLALPKYAVVKKAGFVSKVVAGPFEIAIGKDPVAVTIEQSDILGIPTYLVDCPDYFDREGLYGHPDDAERFAVFCRALLRFIEEGDWQPQVIHGNDWQTALIPIYLKTIYANHKRLSSIGTLHTIHNLAYQGVFEQATLAAVGLDDSVFTIEGLEFYGRVNFLKGALVYADLLNTVSKKYAEEIQTEEFGEKLEGVLARRRNDLYGILNGLDYEEWNPASDSFIAANYEADDISQKPANKAALQQHYDLPQKSETPIFGLVSRLAGQKGLDILAETLPHLLRLDLQFALLGTGEQYYHEVLSRLAAQYPDKMGLALTFDNALAHRIYAGSDMFLMPSRYEPCGLGQMISMRYGTIPIVKRTGGLADTVTDFDPENGEGNGFVFEDHTGVAFLGAIARAIVTYKTTSAWTQVIRNAMSADFSWQRSAREYTQLYEQIARVRS